MKDFFYLEGAYLILGVFTLLITLFVTTRPFMSKGAVKKGLLGKRLALEGVLSQSNQGLWLDSQRGSLQPYAVKVDERARQTFVLPVTVYTGYRATTKSLITSIIIVWVK